MKIEKLKIKVLNGLTALLALNLLSFSPFSLSAAVPLEWTVRVGPRSAAYQAERRHGDALALKASLVYNGQPLAYSGPARLYAQTNGMGAAWWDLAPCTVSSNVLQATWLPSFDTGADVVDIFLGGPSNYQAAARIRFLPSPGSTPNALPLPVPVLDFSTVIITNAPFALSSDVDYSTSNTQLVATIEAKAPAPGNYSAVSNAAMHARSMTDLGVRGAPHGEGDWFTVNGASAQYSDIGGWLFDSGVAIYYSSGMTYNVNFQVEGDDTVTNITLNSNYEAKFIGGGVEYHIIGYTNTLAQVSQIPDVPIASDGLPHMDGTASAGTTNEWARGDHVHPSDTSKMNGAAAYPAWEVAGLYPSGTIRSYNGKLYRVKASVPGTSFTTPDQSSDWELVTIGSLLAVKQDALPYPTNAIPYAAISGAPSGGGQEWRVVNYDAEVDVVNYVTNGIAILTFINAGYAYDINVSTNGWPEGASMFVRGSFRAGATYTIPYDLRLIGYGTWPTNNFQSVWWRSGTNIFVNVLLEE